MKREMTVTEAVEKVIKALDVEPSQYLQLEPADRLDLARDYAVQAGRILVTSNGRIPV